MKYISTRNSKEYYDFKSVFLDSLAHDGGLFLPVKWPQITEDILEDFSEMNYRNLAFNIIEKFVDESIPKSDLKKIINDSYSCFSDLDIAPLKSLDKNNSILELFHGPTFSFKDFAMQVISRLFEYYSLKEKKVLTLIVATSGDTGAAAAAAINGRKGLRLFVLHPLSRISEIQRRQMTTISGENIYNFAVEGTFDDCQKIVKSIFSDRSFCNEHNVSGLNSINWARVMVQTVYYFYSFLRKRELSNDINFIVPTGNFGDIYAGYVAFRMGLPIKKLIIATNENDILDRFMRTGLYQPRTVIQTIAPSMDIQVASNFERLLFEALSHSGSAVKKHMDQLQQKGSFEVGQDSLTLIKNIFSSHSVSHDKIIETIKRVYADYKILIDPHTAIGVAANFLHNSSGQNIILATAHCAKFPDVYREIGYEFQKKEQLESLLNKNENFDIKKNNTEEIKRTIKKTIAVY